MAARYRTYTIEREVIIIEQVEIEVELYGGSDYDDGQALDKAYESDAWYVVREDIGEEYIVDMDRA